MEKKKYIIQDWNGNHLFTDKTFESFEDGWNFLYQEYPVIELPNGKTDDRDDILEDFFVIEIL